MTPLHTALLHGQTNTVRYLLAKYPPCVNAVDHVTCFRYFVESLAVIPNLIIQTSWRPHFAETVGWIKPAKRSYMSTKNKWEFLKKSTRVKLGPRPTFADFRLQLCKNRPSLQNLVACYFLKSISVCRSQPQAVFNRAAQVNCPLQKMVKAIDSNLLF